MPPALGQRKDSLFETMEAVLTAAGAETWCEPCWS